MRGSSVLDQIRRPDNLGFFISGSVAGECVTHMCARLAQLVRSPTASQKVPGSSPGLVEG